MQATLEGVLDPSSSQAPRYTTAGIDTNIQVSNARHSRNAHGVVVARAINTVVVWRRLRVLEVVTTVLRVTGRSCGSGGRNSHADRYQ